MICYVFKNIFKKFTIYLKPLLLVGCRGLPNKKHWILKEFIENDKIFVLYSSLYRFYLKCVVY